MDNLDVSVIGLAQDRQEPVQSGIIHEHKMGEKECQKEKEFIVLNVVLLSPPTSILCLSGHGLRWSGEDMVHWKCHVLRRWHVNTTPDLAAWPWSSQKGFPWPDDREKKTTGLAMKFLFPFQLQDAKSLSLLHRGFQDNLLVVRMKLCWDFQQDGLYWVHQCRCCPCPCGVAFFWDQRTGGLVPPHA